MKTSQKKNISFPWIAHYNYAIKYIVEQGLEQGFIMPPEMTRKTLEIGSRYSPDTVCTPFKTTLGSMIEALEAGADTLVMTNGLCRLGYYGELQEQILHDLGYEFDFVNLSEYSTGKTKDMLKVIPRFSPKANVAKLAYVAAEGVRMAEHFDELVSIYYKNCGFEVNKGDYRRAYSRFVADMEHAENRKQIEESYNRTKAEFKAIPIEKEHPIRVGLIGEYFTIMDPFSNLDLEAKLADQGVEVHRWMNITNRNLHYGGEKNLNVRIHDLCRFEMGPTSTANIWCARDYAERGFDGLIHLKSAGCTPEIDIMPVLQNIGEQYKIPILYLTYDVQTSDTGLMTRVEAFCDMLGMRKKVAR